MSGLRILALVAFCFASPAFAETLGRPSLISEGFFAPKQDQSSYDVRGRHGGSSANYAMMWHKVLLGLGIDSPAPPVREWWIAECGFKQAIKTLEDIRTQLGDDNAYQRIWAGNQNKVLSACNRRGRQEGPPVTPEAAGLPERARTDVLYQEASWNFYLTDYQKALELYAELEEDETAPLRAAAAYMTLRCLFETGRSEEAYRKIEQILVDPSLQEIHADADNYRFVIMYYGGTGSEESRAKLAERHLRWLAQEAVLQPEKSGDLNQSIADYFDARLQLDWYFPLFERKTRRVDWWLDRAQAPTSPRMSAVWKLAPESELVDWLQASWAYNAFDTDWLLALHETGDPYWDGNERIATHAWQRWQQGDGLEWLQVAIERVHPQSLLAPAILQATDPYFSKPWTEETREYRGWLGDVWEHAIRIHLGRGEYEEALALVTGSPDFTSLVEVRFPTQASDHATALNKMLRWLVYTGQFAEARKFLDAYLVYYPGSYRHWRTLLARDWNEATVAAEQPPYLSGPSGNSPVLWEKMVNFLPASMLLKLARQDRIDHRYRGVLTRAALTRAMLLGKDEDIDEYAAAAAEQNLGMRKEVLEGVSGHDPMKYVHLMLIAPRLRPVPFTLSGYWIQNEEKEPFKIDVLNHNDNNWWCRTKESDLEDDLYAAALVTPNSGEFFKRSKLEEAGPYIEEQKEFLARHPFRELVDQEELDALERIPQAPEYLSIAVVDSIKGENWIPWLRSGNGEMDAANLHYAVRTTRYGCQNDGSHAAYSRAAFDLLHGSFEDTIWAKITPYWFSCSHFRNGCESKN